jgi:hypothetical protein
MNRAPLVLFVLLVACQQRLKTPAFVSSAQELKVQGYEPDTHRLREPNIALGSYQVTDIGRESDKLPSVRAGGHAPHSRHEAYRFDLHATGRTLHGECIADARKHPLGGAIAPETRLSCTCREAGLDRMSLHLANGKGTAQAGSAAYQLSALHQSQRSSRVSETLGYAFKGAQGSGAVDVSAPGRAWLPAANLSEDEQLALVCGYASLLVHRPLRFD